MTLILGDVPGDTFTERLKTWLAGMQVESEEDTDFNGVLSYASEVHAAVLGFVLAFLGGVHGLGIVMAVALGLGATKQLSNRKAAKELTKEPWYAMGAGVLGYAAHTALGIDPVAVVLAVA